MELILILFEEIRQTAHHIPGVVDVAEVPARWIGHVLQAELNVSVFPDLTVEQGHEIAKEVRLRILVSQNIYQTLLSISDPCDKSGEQYHSQ